MSKVTRRITEGGKRTVIGKLLEHGLDVFVPYVSVEGIDCAVRNGKGRYAEIQIRVRGSKGKYAHLYQVSDLEQRWNSYVICHERGTDDYFVFPATIFARESVTAPLRKSRRRIHGLRLTEKKKERLAQYLNGFCELE